MECPLTGLVEVTWAKDPKKRTTIDVRQPIRKSEGQFQQQSIDRKGRPVLDVEPEDDSIYLGEPIRLGFRLAHDVKARGFHIELQAEEYTVAKRLSRRSKRRLVGKAIDGHKVPRGVWTKVDLQTDGSMPVSSEREPWSNDASVKVRLDVPWAREESIVMPVRLVYCAGASATDETDAFGFNKRIE